MIRRDPLKSYRCVDGRLYRHDPQHDDPDLETDVGACPDCDGKGCPCPECDGFGMVCLCCDAPIDECECGPDAEPCPCAACSAIGDSNDR